MGRAWAEVPAMEPSAMQRALSEAIRVRMSLP